MIKKINKKKIVEKRVHDVVQAYFIDLQKAGQLSDGDFHAKVVSNKIAQSLLPPQQKKIFNTLSENAMQVKDISKKCRLNSNLVAAQLKQIYSRTMLIEFKMNGKNKLWFRNA